MTFLSRLFARDELNHARELALQGVIKRQIERNERRASVLEVARQIRRETGQPDDPRLKPPKETGDAK